MKYCKNCEVNYQSKSNKCLLCGNQLEIKSDEQAVYNFTPYEKKKEPVRFGVKIFTLVNIISIIICLFINYSADKRIDWSLVVVVSNVYLIIFSNIFISKRRTALKILYLMLLTALLVVILGFSIDSYDWAIDIFLPFALIANTLTITIIILVKRKKWREYVAFLLTSIILNLLIILLNVFGLTKTTWAVNASFFYGLITLLTFFFTSPKEIKDEILRMFHI